VDLKLKKAGYSRETISSTKVPALQFLLIVAAFVQHEFFGKTRANPFINRRRSS
jgi:hypothetical protein